jgi:hypothetical protein
MIFTSADFHAHLDVMNQGIDFSGVGAHYHQNRVAKRVVHTVTNWARTMLLLLDEHENSCKENPNRKPGLMKTIEY